MMSRILTVLAVAALVLGASPAVAAASNTDKLLWLWAEGAQTGVDTCPQGNIEVDTACVAYTIFYAREGLPQVSKPDPTVPDGRAKTPFYASASIVDVVLHPDGSADESLRASGYTFDNTGTYDKAHLSAASVVASIPMSDGSTFDVNVLWAADGAAAKYGNSGPESEQVGFPARAIRDSCTTANFLDHQKNRDAASSGTIGGMDLDSFGWHWAKIFDNWFHWTVTTHGNCTG